MTISAFSTVSEFSEPPGNSLMFSAMVRLVLVGHALGRRESPNCASGAASASPVLSAWTGAWTT